MRRLYLYITFLMYFVLNAKAQTPFDSFVPEKYRPMLELESGLLMDNVFDTVVINLQQKQNIDNICKWLSVDPLADKYPNISPYAYCTWNPINRVDPDGRADYYDVDGNHLCNDGVVDNRVYQQSDKGDVVLGGFATPFSYVGDVTSVKLEFNGEMEKNNHMAIGQLSLKQIGDNFEFVKASYEALSGTIYTKDCLPNGDYNTFKFQNRTDNDAMIRDGVGFSINLKPLFLTSRDLLRIHPDGGNVTGTEGCIGLTGNQSDLNAFVNLMRPLYSSYGNIPLNVNVKNNPNYHHF